ncbi:acyl-CoA dehydrogenase [Geodermatophilus sp. Leaf369]|uniref:acyl-CoA dehydrogenase family protein n=1 Tax=Geodermatophilus sp. Leaf369 TaxID=1736354 RepID=UPI0007012D34|nr:acyl-CoA dehydrogenase family protein [Geodermatophilus sp. Leaf369]KQS57032.1 acyl-CoA dehydrogenase [Geodermatophilus sp. Leaf369]
MSSDQDLVVQTVREILTGHEPTQLTPDRRWDADLWSDLAEAGLTGVGLPEEAGGSGGELADAVAVVATLAAGAGAVPVAEQLLVAGPAVLAAGLDLPDPSQPLTIAVSGAVQVDGSGLLTGTATDVAWAGVAHWLAVVAAGPDGDVLALVDVFGLDATDAANLAGEPRGSYVFDGVQAQVGPLADDVRARYALARAVQLSAAAETVLAWTVQYAGERVQFGRPLAKFQGIQMQLAEMAGEVTAVSALVDAAVQRLDRGEPLELAAAAAKVRAGAAVEVVARQAHQVHGAIGFTEEHRLHHLTKRMWSWRDEAGNELTWARVLGAAVAGDDPWAALTSAV